MYNAARSLAHSARAGEPLPYVNGLERLYKNGVVPRKGELVMIAGEPGTQKSGFALWYTDSMALPALYFSADMNSFQVAMRLAAMRTGRTLAQIQQDIEGGYLDQYLDVLDGGKTIFAYDAHPSLDDILDGLDAYVEVHDSWPEVVVVDNLTDVQAEWGEEYAGVTEIMTRLHQLTRLTGAAVIVLHHMTESNQKHDSRFPHPRRDLIQKVSKKPELILSVALDGSQFRIACVKQRMGPSDATAKMLTTLRIDPAHNSFGYYHYQPGD